MYPKLPSFLYCRRRQKKKKKKKKKEEEERGRRRWPQVCIFVCDKAGCNHVWGRQKNSVSEEFWDDVSVSKD
jgi:hypothetical protein